MIAIITRPADEVSALGTERLKLEPSIRGETFICLTVGDFEDALDVFGGIQVEAVVFVGEFEDRIKQLGYSRVRELTGFRAVDFANEALTAMAGIVCTPERGYMKDGGACQMRRDMEELIRQYEKKIADLTQG